MGVKHAQVVDISADFSPRAVALLLALVEMNCVIVPLTPSLELKKPEFREIAQVEVTLNLDSEDQVSVIEQKHVVDHEILCRLKECQHPGLVLFSSGSTGKSKAAVHDFLPLLKKFETPRFSKRIITFLLFDHIGGINTLLYTLYNAGCVIALSSRTPEVVCEAIEKHQAQILPTSPTFLNLMLLSGAYDKYDLSSLELVTYGTEVMPESTLTRFTQAIPHVKMQQTYGLSELGILRSKSKSSDSLFMKIGGEGFETRISQGLLEIKAESAMQGYLNAPSPFTEDGWFKTGDAVIEDGEYIRILGRESEMINVGGEKVYPAQVESVVQQMSGVEDVAVSAEQNAITGQIVRARVVLSTQEQAHEFRGRLREYCQDKLLPYQIPQKIIIAEQSSHGERFKKMRKIS